MNREEQMRELLETVSDHVFRGVINIPGVLSGTISEAVELDYLYMERFWIVSSLGYDELHRLEALLTTTES